jgi:alpha-beta hydrolase superfamily lysophospholipase
VKTSLLVLGGTDDQLVSPDEVRATARAYGTEAELFSNMAHDMMLEAGWQAVADRILNWLDELAL